MVTMTPVYGSPVAMTITLASLSDNEPNYDTGRESTAVDNKDTDDAIDCLVGGKITMGGSLVASVKAQVEIYLYGSYDDTEFSGGATGTDGTLTPDGKTNMKLLVIIPVDDNVDENKTFKWGPFSVAGAFSGAMPVRWGVFILNASGGTFSSTAGDHEVVYIPVKYESS